MVYQDLEPHAGNIDGLTVSELKEEILYLRKVIEEQKAKLAPCTKPHEEKKYILLLTYVDSDERDFEIVTGRTAARDIIKHQCLCKDKDLVLDVDASMVLVEGRLPEKMSSVYLFCRVVEDKYDDGFDIGDFRTHDEDSGYGGIDDDESDLSLYSNPGKPINDEQNIIRTGNILEDITSTNYKDI